MSLTPEQWHAIQESLDLQLQEEMHTPAPWIASRDRRARDRARSAQDVANISAINGAIDAVAGSDAGQRSQTVTTSGLSVSLGVEQWRVVQRALDSQFYDDEHARPSGLSRRRRQHSRDHQRDRLVMLVEIDRVIADSTGLDALLS